MKKLLFSAALLFAAVLPSFSQRVAVLNGPSSIPCAYLMEENPEYDYETFASAQLALPKLIKEEADFGFLPPNVAAKIYTENKGAVLCLGICGNGNLFLLTKDGSFSDLKQLEGKTAACAGQGATPEYIMNYIFEKKGIKNVTLDFSTPNAQIVPALLSGKFDYAIVPEPFASVAESKDSGIKKISISKEFASISNGKDFPMTVLVVNKKYAEKHKKETADFIKKYEGVVARTLKNPHEAAELAEKHNLGLTKEIAEKAIPNCAFVFTPAKKSKAQIEQLLKLFGQKLPDSKFYY